MKSQIPWDTQELFYVILVLHTCREAMQGLLRSCHGNKYPSLTPSQCFEIYLRICFGPIWASVDKNTDGTTLTDWSEDST